MKKSVLLTIFLVLILIGLSAAAVYTFFVSDRQKPVITIDEKYLEQCDLNDKEAVLKAASAIDNKSDNVEVVLTDIILLSDNVYKIKYMAKDDAGNIATASVSVKRDDIVESTPESNAEQESSNQTETGDESGSEAEGQTDEDVTLPESEPENGEQTDGSGEQTVETEAPAEASSEAPVITLTTHDVNMPVGTRFNYLNYIDNITDDVDDYEVLSRRIRLEGTYDTGVVGNYELVYFVVDTDGNRSNLEELTLVVE